MTLETLVGKKFVPLDVSILLGASRGDLVIIVPLENGKGAEVTRLDTFLGIERVKNTKTLMVKEAINLDGGMTVRGA
jgi:hypothetical protein